MRVIAGTARGRKIEAPEGRDTRPITDRAKEGIFNMLGPIIELDGANVLDLYAGSGSFGLECLSRGAGHVTFVDRSRLAAAVIQRNLATLGFTDRGTVLTSSVEGVVATTAPVDIVFCDPPYADDVWAELLPRIPADIVVGHAEFEIPLTEGWIELKRRKYSRARIVIAERSTSPED